MGSDSKVFNGTVMVISGFFTGFSIVNAIYYSKLMNNNSPNPPISNMTAKILMIFNIILVILAAGIFVWSLYRLSFNRGGKENIPVVIQPKNISQIPVPVSNTITSSPDKPGDDYLKAASQQIVPVGNTISVERNGPIIISPTAMV